MPMMERFTRREVLRILDVSEKQLNYWERLHLVRPQSRWGEKFYRFGDLISLRTVKQLTDQHVPARRLRRAIEALQHQLAEVKAPLSELRILSNGRNIAVERDGACLEPLSGQLLLNFEARELGEKVRVMPHRTAEEWFALALDAEVDPAARSQAIDAYQQVIELRPDWLDPHMNLGALLYERGDLEEAALHFGRAIELAPDSALAHFNLGSVLDELGELAGARDHLQRAVRLKPNYADAHYNLAVVYEKLGAHRQARQHWRRYVELDPHSPWADFARQQLAPDSTR